MEELDPVLAKASKEELERLTLAEGVQEKRRSRRRLNRFMVAGQAIAAYVALAGFFANAYQNWSDKKAQQQRAEVEQQRWSMEFKRARDADKYRAFFETSALVTDTNENKHVVGYTLLREFVNDPEYKDKAMTLLETSLSQELRQNTAKVGIDQERRVTISAIVAALGQSSDCQALENASKSVDRLTYRQSRIGDAEETSEVFSMYVRHVLGAALKHCQDADDFDRIRVPIRQALIKMPMLAGAAQKLEPRTATRRITEVLRDRCEDELSFSTTSDCDQVFKAYQTRCATLKAQLEFQEACEIVDNVVERLPASQPTQR